MGESQKIMQVRSARQVPVRVQLLDDDIFNHSVDKRAVGWILFDKVCEHVNIIEKDYFGLNYYVNGEKFWVNNDKKIAKQLKGQNWDFNFEVKFYPADPTQLAEDISRYQLCLQIRRDIVNERLPCSFVTYTLLGSYTAQSELGDYDTEEFGSGYKYLKDIQFAPHQDKELLMKIAELHRQHKGETPEEAEVHFLENATKLAMYGVELHAAKDAEGRDIQLGVCASGLIVYKDKQQINRFVWPKVLKISYRRNKYYIKIRPGEFETFASLIGFKLANVKYAKRLWKISVEHHSFFRFREPEHQKSVSFLPRFGSRFRYSGRTQFQTRQVVAEENRESPFFDRVLSKRGTFGGRTTNMRKRDEERQQRRDEMRRAPFPPQTKIPPHEQKKEHPPEPTRTPPEPKHAPPIAPKPGKPKPSPRGPSSVDDNASLDRELTGSLNDSFDDVPDRKSRMEKIHAVATPLAALMQSKKEHEQHEEEHHREEAHKHRDEPNSDDDHRDDHHRANRHRDDHHDDDHDRSYDQEVGKSSMNNQTNQTYKTDRTYSGKGDHYTRVNKNERVRKSKSMGDNLMGTKNILFSHPASSFESVTSQGDYDASNEYIDGLRLAKSEKYLGKSGKRAQNVEPEPVNQPVSAEIVYSEIPHSHYDEIGLPKTEQIYAEIDEVKTQVKNLRDNNGNKNNNDIRNNLYEEIPEENDKYKHKMSKIKIHGRKSKFFKENQKFEPPQATKPLKSQSISPDTKTIKLTQPKKLFQSPKVKNDQKVTDEVPSNSKYRSMLEVKSKTSSQMPIYAKINKHKKVDSERTANSGADLADSVQDSNLVDLPNLNDNKTLKEELKMYILTPEKVNRNSGFHDKIISDNMEKDKTDLKNFQNKENLKDEFKPEPFSCSSIVVESSNEIVQHEAAEKLRIKNVAVERKVNHLDQEQSEQNNELGAVHSVDENETQGTILPENIVKVLSLSSLEDGESVHNTSSVISDPEQGVNISELETEGVEMDIRKRIASSSLSSLYKLTFDGNSNTGTDSSNLGDEKLERYNTLSSESCNLHSFTANIGEGAAKSEAGNKHMENVLSHQRLSLDDDLERFSTISTDSSDFENAEESRFGSNLIVPSMTRSRQRVKAEVHETVKSELDKSVTDEKHVYKKAFPSQTNQMNVFNLPSAEINLYEAHKKKEKFLNPENNMNEKVKRSIKTNQLESKNPFEIETYDEEPFSRHRIIPCCVENDFEIEKPTNINRDDSNTMDFFQKPKLQDNVLNKPIINEKDEHIHRTKGNSQKIKNKNSFSSGNLNECSDVKQVDVDLDYKQEDKTFCDGIQQSKQESYEKQEQSCKYQFAFSPSESKPITEELTNKEEPMSEDLEDSDTPVKSQISFDTKQQMHLQFGKDKIKKQLFSNPEEIKYTYSRTEIPIIEGSKVFTSGRRNDHSEQLSEYSKIPDPERDELQKPTTVFKPFYLTKQIMKNEVNYNSLPKSCNDSDHTLSDSNMPVDQRPSLSNFFPAEKQPEKSNGGNVKNINFEVKTEMQTFKTICHDTKMKSEKVPIFIKDSKVFDKNPIQKFQHFKQADSDSEENSKIVTGNIKPFQDSENCTIMPIHTALKSESSKDGVKEKSRDLKKPDIVGKGTKPCDNLSVDSTSSHNSNRNGHVKEVKTKITPGVIHMINPCPSGWIEGGLKSTKKTSETKKKEKTSTCTVSVLDFEPQEVSNAKEYFVSSLDSYLTDTATDNTIQVDKSTHQQDDPKKMLENAQQADLLCRRVWKKYIRSGKNGNKKTHHRGKDENDENEGEWIHQENDQEGIKDADEEPVFQSELKRKDCAEDDDGDIRVEADFGKSKDENIASIVIDLKKVQEDIDGITFIEDKKEDNVDSESDTRILPSKVLKNSNTLEKTKNNDEIDGDNSEKRNSTYIEQNSLHLKLESLGLGDVKLDEDALKQQSLESKQIDFYAEEMSTDSDSGPSETDSESGDEIELASFEMPGFVVNPQSDDGFDSEDNYSGIDIMQQFAIDCSFEDVKSYKMEETDQEGESILCECNFQTSEPEKVNCKLHRSKESKNTQVPHIIDDTPHVPIRSNLKRKSKSESNLSERRVRFEENLPVYKSSNNLGLRKHLFAKRKSSGNEDEKMKYIEDFITCLFDTEPRNIALGNKQSDDTVSSNQIGENSHTGNETAMDYFGSVDADRKLDKFDMKLDDNAFDIDQPIESDMIEDELKVVSRNKLEGNDEIFDDSITTCTNGSLEYDKELHDNMTSTYDLSAGEMPSGNDGISWDKTSHNSDKAKDVMTLNEEKIMTGFDEKSSKIDCSSKKSPKIVKPVSGGRHNSSTRPTLVRVSTQQRANENMPVMIPINVSNSQSQEIEDKRNQIEEKAIPTILLTSPTGEMTGSQNASEVTDHPSCRGKMHVGNVSSIHGDESDIKIDVQDAFENAVSNDSNFQEPVSPYTSSCEAELKNEKDHECDSGPYNDDGFDKLNNDINNFVQSSYVEPHVEFVPQSVQQDSDCADLDLASKENEVVAFSTKPRDQITKYTFSVNDDTDTECPKIKTVTYEYVTEYKLNNVKIQYQQNRKTQTDNGTERVEKDTWNGNHNKTVKSRIVNDKRNVSNQMKENDKSDTRIIMEEVIDKSVCYPLGPSQGTPSCESSTSCEINNSEEQIEKSVAVKAMPERVDRRIHGLPKPSDVNDMQVIEHNSKKYLWQSCQTKIPFKPIVAMLSAKPLYSVDKLNQEAQLKKNWTLCDEVDTCIQETYRNSNDNEQRNEKKVVFVSSESENFPETTKVSKIFTLESQRNVDVKTDLREIPIENLLGNENSQLEALQGKDRLRQFCRRKLLKRHKNFDDESSLDFESSNHRVLSESDQKDGLEFEIGETKKVSHDSAGKRGNDLCDRLVKAEHEASKRRHDGDDEGDDGETFLAAVMQERLPELHLHDQSNETMFVVQAVAAIALGTVLVFLLPYVG